jgi:hypothetical protein
MSESRDLRQSPELRSSQFEFCLLHQRAADARYVGKGVFVKPRLLFRGLQGPGLERDI